MAKKTIDDILSEKDDLGLLANVKLPTSAAGTSNDRRVRQKFEEINAFIDRYKRLPGEVGSGGKVSPTEKMLQFALNGIRSDPTSLSALRNYDRHGLLPVAPESAPSSLDEIIDSDSELLTTGADDIFTFQHAPKPTARPDRKAERKPCADFSLYRPLFDTCAADLQAGRRKSLEFRKEQDIQVGEFFILNGAMLYVAEMGEQHLRGGKANARLRLIFDNGTESDNLLRSLSAELYKDGPAGRGRRITSPESGPLFQNAGSAEPQARQDVNLTDIVADLGQRAGLVYVLKSLSTDPDIRKLDGYLFKIGFTTGDLETRISTAKDDPTFLLAPVHPVKTYTVFNLNTVKLENLLHRFFGEVRLDIEIKDRFGKSCRPREWFLLPLEVIEEAIQRMVDGSIIHYRYDEKSGQMVRLVSDS
jgi:hypothetical protein